jgi:hypothetical protein
MVIWGVFVFIGRFFLYSGQMCTVAFPFLYSGDFGNCGRSLVYSGHFGGGHFIYNMSSFVVNVCHFVFNKQSIGFS